MSGKVQGHLGLNSVQGSSKKIPRLESAMGKVVCRNRRSGGGPVSAEAMHTRTLPTLLRAERDHVSMMSIRQVSVAIWY